MYIRSLKKANNCIVWLLLSQNNETGQLGVTKAPHHSKSCRDLLIAATINCCRGCNGFNICNPILYLQYFMTVVQVSLVVAACLRSALSGLWRSRCVGLPHGHRLLGQEVRLHVGRGEERHEGDGGSPGEVGEDIDHHDESRSSENCRPDIQQRDSDLNLQPERYLRPEGYGGES